MNPLSDRATRADALVREHWPEMPNTALVAVGGYGRMELFPHSDIDLLILSDQHDPQQPLAAFLRVLWDSGLRVSQSSHSVEECLNVDGGDIEFSVSLLDCRFLVGDRSVFARIRTPSRDQLAPGLARLTRERHGKYANTIYHLEPNVKEAPGAMRDLQVLRWLAQLDGTTVTLPAHAMLFRIRSALHEISGRDTNILNFAMQDDCSDRFGLRDPAMLMEAYYREAAPLFRACLRRLDEVESRRSPLFAGLRDRAARLSNAEFSVVGGRVYFRIPPADAESLAHLFTFVARHGLPLARDTEDRVSQFAIASMRWKELRVLLDLPFAAMAIRAMHDTGFLAKLFPGLRGIESLVVRDFYHRYTVDEHTLVTIDSAGRLKLQQDRFGELARETPDYPLLLTALLFHDAGKGTHSESHAEASVEMAAEALRAIEMSTREQETVLFLIERHLEMSRLMLTRDLTDPATAAGLAKLVGTTERLKLLTLLTYCDISAVNPEALTPWRASLLWQLYVATERDLTRALRNDVAAEGMPARYSLTHSAEEIATHRRMELERRVTRLDRAGDTYRLTVVSPDRPALFAQITGALAGFGMNILRAESFKNERNTAVQTFSFADPMRTLELNPSERDRLDKLIGDVVSGAGRAETLLKGRPNPKHSGQALKAAVSYDNTASTQATLFELTARDRPGLLYDIARSIATAGCNIDVVLIDTEGTKAIDVFYVTCGGQPLDDLAAAQLRDTLQLAI